MSLVVRGRMGAQVRRHSEKIWERGRGLSRGIKSTGPNQRVRVFPTLIEVSFSQSLLYGEYHNTLRCVTVMQGGLCPTGCSRFLFISEVQVDECRLCYVCE
jgi:hypothetical protein